MTTRALGLAALLAASGCLGSALTGDGGAANMGAVATRFYAEVAPIIQPACGGCHGMAGGSAPAFMLAQPDLLQNLLTYPGIIGATPEKSRLYIKGTHEGPAFTPTQAPVVYNWIVFYNANVPMSDGGTGKPTIAPFAPQMGMTNSIDLSVLDPMLAGMQLTFTPKLVGSSLELASLTVVAAATSGIHIAHPLFVTWDAKLNPTPDPVDSFSNLDETVAQGKSAPLGPGLVFLPSFATGDLINVVFTTIEPKMVSTSDGGVTTGCKALTMFQQTVKPLMQQSCNSCHVGNTPTAGFSMDFNMLGDAAVCKNALTEINTTTPASSLLLQRPNPAVNDSHPVKLNPFTNWQTALTNWINAEK
jgi:hypothetical protein